MESLVPFFVQDGVGVVTINNPPVNALSSGVLEGLKVAVEIKYALIGAILVVNTALSQWQRRHAP